MSEDSPQHVVYLGTHAMARGIDHMHQSGVLAERSRVHLDRSLHPIVATLGQVGPQRTSDLAEALALKKSTVSRHVSRLEDLGLVERAQEAADGRAWTLKLSPEGRKAFRAVRAAWEEVISEVLATAEIEDPDRFAREMVLVGRLLGEAR